MLFLLLSILFIAVLWGVSFLINLLFGGATSSVDRALHTRHRRKFDEEQF